MFGRILSLFIAAGYLALGYFSSEAHEGLFQALMFLAIPMACIWWPDGMSYHSEGGSMSFFSQRPAINEVSPPSLVKIMGWILLLLPILIIPLVILVTAK